MCEFFVVGKRLRSYFCHCIGDYHFFQGLFGCKHVVRDLRDRFSTRGIGDRNRLILSFIPGHNRLFFSDFHIQSSAGCRNLFDLFIFVKRVLEVLRAVVTAVDILDNDLADELVIKLGGRFHDSPESLVKAHRIHFIAGRFPLAERFEPSLFIPPG